MKIKILSLIILMFMLVNVGTSAESKDSYSCGVNWYVRRSGNKRPEISEEQKVIEKYDGYYIDKKLGDDSSKKRIYLTFDAGYENGNISKVLDVLKEKNVSAAFFILNHLVLSNTELVKRMACEGHLVCNHTKDHCDITKLESDDIIKNLSSLEKVYEEKTGMKRAKYFRFPEGRYSEKSLKTIKDLGYKTVFWSFGYADWDNENQPDIQYAIDKIISNTHNGEVILLHPTSETNAKILGELIEKWREMGYSFGTLDELVI